jgi:hypothetical protein
MPTCEHCQELLLDYVYALLEESELQEMREHLSACSSCQTVLAAAQAEQKLLAHAARAISNVPEFTLPTSQPAEVSPNATTVPLIVPSAPKRSVWRRPWVAWPAAAAVLLALGSSVAAYRHELNARQEALAGARRELEALDQQLAALPVNCEAELRVALRILHRQTGPYLHVAGPTTLQAHGKAPVHITTRGIDGELLASTIRIKLVEPETGNVLFLTRFDSDGQARSDIDTGNAKPSTALNLVIEADTAHGMARIAETVRVPAPSYVTRLDINKTAYQLKDVVFFRALVLDRCSLTPPSRKFAMRAELKNPAGMTAAFVELETREGGILAGELPIAEHFPAGPYTLHVRPTKSPEVQSVAQGLEVVRELPGIRLDQPRYAQGGVLTGDVTLPRSAAGEAKAKGTIGNNKAVDVTLRAQIDAAEARTRGAAGGALGKQGAVRESKQEDDGRVFRFQMKIPENLPAAESRVPLTLEFENGARRKVLVPLEPTEFAIDFFPEGGDLIEGVKNRVFYRVRAKSGEPVTGDGRVILLTGKNDIVDTHYKLGLGYLDFTPDSKETYTVRITTPMKVAVVANPFAKPGIRKDGVVLHVPRAVGKEGDAIRLVLRQQAPARKVVLLAHCRGQIVDERTVDLKPGNTDVTLQPSADAHGMIRVTAYEVVGNRLQPLAERLVYRAAAQRLDLGFTLSTQQLQPGLQNLKAKIQASDEKGQAAPAWILASIVDERFQPRPQSLSAHFLLLNEIRTGADIDNVQLILNDAAESTQVLERFLGTHGWRRFVPAQETSLVTLAKADARQPSILFSRENAPLTELQEKYQAQRTTVLRPVHEAALEKATDLNNQRESLATAVNAAEQGLFDLEHNVRAGIGLALVSALALLLLASLALMAVGVYRLVRAHKLATPAFGGAFAGLAACLAVVLVSKSLGTLEFHIPSNDQPPMASHLNKVLEKVLAAAPKVGILNDAPMRGVIALALPGKDADRDLQSFAKADGRAGGAGFGAPAMRSASISDQAMDALAGRNRNEMAALAGMPANRLLSAERYEKAHKDATIPLQASADALADKAKVKPAVAAQPPAPGAPAPVAAGPSAKKEQLDSMARHVEYFHQHVPNLQADTLLWHPTLWLEQGSAEVHFDIASGQATYRVLLLAHGPSGRFGFFETRLDVPAAGDAEIPAMRK